MKIDRLSSHFLVGLTAITLLASLLSSVNAHEDPAEAQKRRGTSRLATFRSQYRSAYMLPYTEPRANEFLFKYPESITDIVEKLDRFGTDKWRPDDDIAALFKTLDKLTLKLIMSPFHPKMVEWQPESIRIKHWQVSEALVNWLHEHKPHFYSAYGKEFTDALIRRYQELRKLASLATTIPKA